MKKITVFGVLLLALYGPLVRSAPPPAEAFGRVAQMANLELSPNGERIAYTDNASGLPRAVMFDLAARKTLRIIDIDPRMKLRRLIWADNETLLLELSFTQSIDANQDFRFEMFRTIAADASGGETRVLLMNSLDRSLVSGSSLLAWRTSKPKTVIMSSMDYSQTAAPRYKLGSRLNGGRKNSGWVARLFEVDTRTGKGTILDEGNALTETWVIGDDGRPLARVDWDAEQRTFRILRTNGAGWTEIYQQNDGEQLSVYGLTADKSAIVALGARGQPHKKAWAIPLDGSAPKVLAEDSEYDIGAVVRDRFSGAPTGVFLGGSNQDFRWFDAKAEARYKGVSKSFPGRDVEVYGRSEDHQKVLARVSGPSAAPTYYLVDFKTRTADIVGEDYPGLANVTLGEVRSIQYAASDGASIPAYVTLPSGREAKRLPLVVAPHGGPEARDQFDFDWFAQFFASRGYAVLQPQFRGSTGFGEAHRLAGNKQWGKLMQQDVTDGVKALVAQGIADPKKVCIVGASYGGYAALAGAAFTPDLYACAVSINGVADLPNILGQVAKISGEESDSLAYWRAHIGSPFDPDVIAKSPARAAEGIKAPVLLIHGVDDTVVAINQSETMAHALELAKKPYRFVKLPGEDHWLSRSDTRIQVLQETEKFLAKYLGAEN